jgi:hypothetical protein
MMISLGKIQAINYFYPFKTKNKTLIIEFNLLDVSFANFYKKIEESLEEITLNIKSDFISSIQNLKSKF